jgi:hypothetical protein
MLFKKIPFYPFKADCPLFRLRGRTVAYPAGIPVRRLLIPEAGAVSLDPGPGMDTVTVTVRLSLPLTVYFIKKSFKKKIYKIRKEASIPKLPILLRKVLRKKKDLYQYNS